MNKTSNNDTKKSSNSNNNKKTEPKINKSTTINDNNIDIELKLILIHYEQFKNNNKWTEHFELNNLLRSLFIEKYNNINWNLENLLSNFNSEYKQLIHIEKGLTKEEINFIFEISCIYMMNDDIPMTKTVIN